MWPYTEADNSACMLCQQHREVGPIEDSRCVGFAVLLGVILDFGILQVDGTKSERQVLFGPSLAA